MTAAVLVSAPRSLPRYRWRLVLGSALLLAALHAFALPRLGLGIYTPDLFSLVAVYIGLFASRHGRYWPSLVFGLVRDAFSIGLLGSYAVLYSLLHKFNGRVRGKLDPETLPNAVLLTFIGVFLSNFGYHFMLAAAGDGIGWSAALWRCLVTAGVTAPFAAPLFPLMHRGLAALRVGRDQAGCFNF